ncbi:MAG: DUF4349 domain-containing protein [Spartobacteria bacterium]
MPNDALHQEIESWLAADLHDQLSSEEQLALQKHLSSCGFCRALQEEEKQMHQLLENTLARESADPAFEQRMVSRFRDKVPEGSGGLLGFFSGLLRMRAAQITAVAALLLTLVQVGKMVTGERSEPGRAETTFAFAPPPLRNEKKTGDERPIVTGSNIPTAAEVSPQPGSLSTIDALASRDREKLERSLVDKAQAAAEMPPAQAKEDDRSDHTGAAGANRVEGSSLPAPVTPADSRKLIRSAQLELQVLNYDAAVQRLTTFASETGGFVATQSSLKLPNGKLQGTVVIKVLPENLDRFLEKARGLGELKNQTLGSQDVTKAYLDTDARLRNAQRMETRLLEMLEKKTGKVSDLLEVEKELARVRESIEQMQGELKYYEALVQYATVTISLAEKDLSEPAAFLLKETANLALFSTDVEKTFGEVKTALQNAKAQIVQSTLDRDNSGQATARMTLLLAPEESDSIIARIKAMGRVQNFNVQTERVAQNGSGMSETAKVERDKVQLNLVISRYGEEPSVQQTSLRILTGAVTDKVARLKASVASAGGELRSSTFSRNPDGQEVANLTLRVPMESYAELVASFAQLGDVKDLSVQRNDQPGTTANPATAPADISIQIYNPGKIVSESTGITATIRRTLGQGVAALMWSLRMIGVAIAFLAPWALAAGGVIWLVVRFARRRG